MNSYTGYKILNDDEMAHFYAGQYPVTLLNKNEYLILGSDLYKHQDNQCIRVDYPIIESSWGGIVKPRNIEQRAAIDMLLDNHSTVKLITGTWGVGKTMLLAAAALYELQKNKFEKIVWVRNNVQVKDTDPLGALPGTELDKVLPYAMPLADHCGGIDGLKCLIESGKLEIIPLGFLRGRSIRNSIIIASEAENLTKEHIQLLLGRVDEGSNLWMDADLKQRDKAVFEKSAGIETMIDRLKGEELFGYVHLVKSERSATARLADKLND